MDWEGTDLKAHLTPFHGGDTFHQSRGLQALPGAVPLPFQGKELSQADTKLPEVDMAQSCAQPGAFPAAGWGCWSCSGQGLGHGAWGCSLGLGVAP